MTKNEVNELLVITVIGLSMVGIMTMGSEGLRISDLNLTISWRMQRKKQVLRMSVSMTSGIPLLHD